MTKYNKKIVNKIIDLIKSDNYTISEICAIVKINEDTFYTWKKTKSDFSDLLTRARESFDETLVVEAKNSLRKKVNGYDFDEKKTTYINGKDGKPVIKEQTTIKKHFQPDIEAVKFVLTNKVPNEYKNKQNNELSGIVGAAIQVVVQSKQAADEINKLG